MVFVPLWGHLVYFNKLGVKMEEKYLFEVDADVDFLEFEEAKHKVNKRQAKAIEELEGGYEDETL